MRFAINNSSRIFILKTIFLFLFLLLILTACANYRFEETRNSINTFTISKTTTSIIEETQNPLLFSTLIPTGVSATETSTSVRTDWKELPVIPDVISWTTQEIYMLGQELHNNPYAFSVLGDCESSPSWFLGDFDRGNSYYSLGDNNDLELVIDAFHGSFERKNLAVGNGYNTAAVLSPLWADPIKCMMGESPLECEIRYHNPSYVFILLGTNDIYNLVNFEINLRKILDSLVNIGVVPILATKADDLEGGNRINAIISDLAYEYDIPLWNYWRAVQQLPNKGLQSDNAHLTWAKNDFGDPKAMENAWPWRNLTALQVLDKLWRTMQQSGY